jgi:fumarylpyruvate hydrolase
LSIAGAAARTFPIRRIYCVGRNYADHAREMGHDPDREPPFFFTKPADAAVPSGSILDFPTKTGELHHEVELVVALRTGGRDITAPSARDCVFGYAVGLDMTRRDLQSEAKRLGRPWDLAKGFDESMPCGPLHAVEDVGHLDDAEIRLEVNGEVRQRGRLSQQIWSVEETIAYLSSFVALSPGDLIMTGTPSGVGSVSRGDTLHGVITGLEPVTVTYR